MEGYRAVTVTIHGDLLQGTDEWLAVRCGKITASTMSKIVPAAVLKGKEGKPRNNKEVRLHLYELAAQRITGRVEDSFVSDDMLRGMCDEEDALQIYASNHAEIERVGFVENDELGFPIGYSPDALVGNDGLVEVKSRLQKHQIHTILNGVVPSDYVAQLQTGLLVSQRAWVDFISYCPGLPMFVERVYPDEEIQEQIKDIAAIAEGIINEMVSRFRKSSAKMIPTERRMTEIVV